jgi:hypothetical protein
MACIACGGHEATRFVGTAMDDAAADSSVRLTLVLWPRTDSTFVGHLQVDMPIGIAGGVSAWHGKDGLVLYAISDNGDTTSWGTRLTGPEIGGLYEVTGGPHKGLAGTWRARLQDGPPPSAETLRRYARSAWIPPFDAVWPGVIAAALLVLAARWVRSAPETTIDLLADAYEEHGVGGWLALFTAGQIVGLLVMPLRGVHFLDIIEKGTWHVGAVIPGLRGMLVVEKLVFLVQVTAPPVGLYLIAKRSRFAPRYWFAYLAAVGIFSAYDLAAGAWVSAAAERVLSSDGSADTTTQTAQTANLRNVLTTILWSCYWARSKRVRARFGQCAHDEPPTSLPAAAPALAD